MEELLQTFEDWKPKRGFGAIYQYDFDNGMSYIGVTRFSVMSRYKNHLRADNLVDRALRTHKHSIKILEIVPEEQLADEEIRLIAEKGTRWPDGYNFSAGGEGNRMHPDSKKKLSEMRMGEANPMWGRHLTISKKNIDAIRKSRIREVRCIDTGKVYESLTEASKDTNTPISKITVCCNGYRDSANNLCWEYADYPDLASFNTLCRCFAKTINWQTHLEENKERYKQRGYELSQSNIGKKRKPYNLKNKKCRKY